VNRDHGRFLDYSQRLGLNVMPGYHVEPSKIRLQCPEFDCFQKWKKATIDGFERGYRKGGSWHPAVAMAILLNEADGFGSLPECQPQGEWCRVKAAISALDGVLAAEKEAGVDAGRVKFTVTWSFATRASIDGKMRGPGIYGFQDMVAVIHNPQIAKYTPRTPGGSCRRLSERGGCMVLTPNHLGTLSGTSSRRTTSNSNRFHGLLESMVPVDRTRPRSRQI